jgi:hypothetical protein
MQRVNLVGNKYGKLTVIAFAGVRNERTTWKCLCECGNEVVVERNNLRASGHTQSCGCYRERRVVEANITHGHYLNGKQARLYSIWAGMKRRCLNDHVKTFKYYGARGITICHEWLKFEAFRDWALSNGYAENLTIDRKGALGNYEPTNCQWITKSENARKGAIEASARRRVQEETGIATYIA